MENFLTIAKIVRPQGIRGEVKVLALTDTSEDLCAFKSIYVGDNVYKVLKVRPVDTNYAVLTLAGVADRNAAEQLRGLDIKADRTEAPDLPENTYYIVDIIGCSVVDEKGREYGKIEDISKVAGARQSVYTLSGKNEIMFVAAEGVITDIDVKNRTVTVDSARFVEVALGI